MPVAGQLTCTEGGEIALTVGKFQKLHLPETIGRDENSARITPSEMGDAVAKRDLAFEVSAVRIDRPKRRMHTLVVPVATEEEEA